MNFVTILLGVIIVTVGVVSFFIYLYDTDRDPVGNLAYLVFSIFAIVVESLGS